MTLTDVELYSRDELVWSVPSDGIVVLNMLGQTRSLYAAIGSHLFSALEGRLKSQIRSNRGGKK